MSEKYSAGNPFPVEVGLTSAGMLPAKSRKVRQVTGLHRIALPRKGSFQEGNTLGLTGDFDISPANGQVLFGDLLKVMLTMKAYPAMEDNQMFVLSTIEVVPDMVTVVGRVVEFIEDEDNAATEEV